MARRKIALVGAGNIGGTLAHLTLLRRLGDVILFDVTANFAKGKALDLSQCTPIEGIDLTLTGTNQYQDLVGAEVVIVTAGMSRKPGMTRDDLLANNAKVMETVGAGIKQYCDDPFIICITNPLDVMVSVLQQASNASANKIVGMAGVLDSARFRLFLSWEFKVSVSEVNAYVLGGHGDTMVPLTGLSTVAGISLDKHVELGNISASRLEEIIQRTRTGGGEIVALLERGSAFYAPATAAIEMAEAYLQDQQRVLPCAAKLINNEYGVKQEIFVGVPTQIGARGVERIIEVPLKTEEQLGFDKSVEAVIELNNSLPH